VAQVQAVGKMVTIQRNNKVVYDIFVVLLNFIAAELGPV
jgi:hypothetical protein